MTNWQIRDIRSALGGDPKSRGRKIQPIQKAVDHLIQHTTDPRMVREAYLNNTQNKIVEKSKTICKEFQDIFNAERDANQPLSLAKDAKTKLEVLKECLKDLKKTEDGIAIMKELVSIKKIVKACFSAIKLPKHRKK